MSPFNPNLPCPDCVARHKRICDLSRAFCHATELPVSDDVQLSCNHQAQEERRASRRGNLSVVGSAGVDHEEKRIEYPSGGELDAYLDAPNTCLTDITSLEDRRG